MSTNSRRTIEQAHTWKDFKWKRGLKATWWVNVSSKIKYGYNAEIINGTNAQTKLGWEVKTIKASVKGDWALKENWWIGNIEENTLKTSWDLAVGETFSFSSLDLEWFIKEIWLNAQGSRRKALNAIRRV